MTNSNSPRSERSATRSSARGGLAWAALLTAAAAQALFWLPLGYREPEPEGRAVGGGIGLLSRRAFPQEAACRRFLLWMDRHDPANFLKSGARGGFSALLPPEAEAPRLSEARPIPAAPAIPSAATSPVLRPLQAVPERRPTELLPPPAAAAPLRRVSGHPRVLRADGTLFDPAGAARWVLPVYSGNPEATLLAVGGAAPCRRIELLRSSGVAALDRLALVETTRALADFADGELLTVCWPERDAATEGGNAAP